MPHTIACLDMELPEIRDWVRSNIRPTFDPRFISLDSPELLQTIRAAEFLVLFESRLTAELIGAATKLKLIQLPQVGYDNIDLVAAKDAGVPICHIPGEIIAGSVAEHTLMLILATMRRLIESDSTVRMSKWLQLEMFRKGLHDIAEVTLGIVGLGAIGKAVAAKSRALVGRVVYYDIVRPATDMEHKLGVTFVPLNELLRISDVVTLHVPLNEKTVGLIGYRELSIMKPSAILINAARGPIVEQEAFVECMREGRLRGAAFDVLWEEPPPADSPLLTLDNMIFTPHIASGSQEVTWKGMSLAFENIYRVAAGEEPRYRV